MFATFDQVIEFFEQRKTFGIKPGLERIKALLRLSGEPQKRMKAIHIAGTNGKGSTSHFLKDALIANNYKTGLFSSPSQTLTGHIWIQDRPITEAAFIIELNRLYPVINVLDEQDMHPTEFEIMTAIACLYFSQHTDIAVIEAGMGGREDTTNCFVPILSIITNVAMDHTGFLGERIEQIAYHKAGIIKKGIPVITGDLKLNANRVIVEEANRCEADLYQLGDHFTIRTPVIKNDLQHVTWQDGSPMTHTLQLQMKGVHQAENAALAVKAIKLLKQKGYMMDLSVALTAMKHTRVPGRFEQVCHDPQVILDGAHNPDGIESFLSSVQTYYPSKERHLLFGVFKDKDVEAMLDKLRPYFATITLTTFDHPRAASKDELQSFLVNDPSLYFVPWREAVSAMNDANAVYFITGSLHFIMQVEDFFDISKR